MPTFHWAVPAVDVITSFPLAESYYIRSRKSVISVGITSMYSNTDECKDNIINVISYDIINVIYLSAFAAVFVLVFVAKFFFYNCCVLLH